MKINSTYSLSLQKQFENKGLDSAFCNKELTGFRITAMGRPHSDLGLPTTKHERVLGLSTLSYKIVVSIVIYHSKKII